jgi:NAD(P)H dehydrogenase (quinone)
MGRNVAQHAAVIEAASAAGVELLAYTSVLGGPRATFAIAEPHIATERILKQSGLSSVLLRNGWYNENYTGALPLTLQSGAVIGCSGNGRVATASRADYAAAAATILADGGREGAAYELSGDTAWTLEEYAAEVSDRPVARSPTRTCQRTSTSSSWSTRGWPRRPPGRSPTPISPSPEENSTPHQES